MLYARAKLGQAAGPGDVEGAIAEVALQGSLFPSEVLDGGPPFSRSRRASGASSGPATRRRISISRP